jgi:hypothetical protein
MTQSVQTKSLLVDEFSDSSKARDKKKILDDLSNSGRPFDYMVKAGQPARSKIVIRRPLQEKDRYRRMEKS